MDPVVEPAQLATSDDTLDGAEVRLSVPAHGAFLSLIRTTTAAIGARVDLTIDEIEDLRIAVDEAAAVLLPVISAGGRVDVVFTYAADRLTIVLSGPTGAAPPPDETGFGWTVLTALAGTVQAETFDGTTAITLSHLRATAAEG